MTLCTDAKHANATVRRQLLVSLGEKSGYFIISNYTLCQPKEEEKTDNSNLRKRKKTDNSLSSSSKSAVRDHCDLYIQSVAFQETVSKSGRVSKLPKHFCM